jgi:3',5'-cyclic AMP phosphodiesterase CpdA
MRIIHAADIHIGATSDALLEAARLAMAGAGGEALVVSGDLTQRGTRAEFSGARAWVDSIGLPAIAVPGNHDTPLLHAGHRLFKPFERYTDYFGDLTQPLKAGPARLFPLNTSRGWQTRTNWAEGSVDIEDLVDIITAAASASEVPVMVCHHPFTPFSGAGLRTRTRRGDEASVRLASSPFRILLTGHVHTPHAEWIHDASGSYLAVSAGTLSLRLRSAPPGFNVLALDEAGLTVTPFALEDGAFAPMTGKTFSWTSAPQEQTFWRETP